MMTNKLMHSVAAFVLLLLTSSFAFAGESDFSRAQNGKFGVGMVDFSGRQGYSTIFGEQVVGGHEDNVSVQFQYNNSLRDLIIFTPTGTGSQSNANSMMRVSAGTGVGTQFVESLSSVRYRPGHEVMTHFTARFIGAGVDVTHSIGIGDEDNRVSFGTEDGVFGVWFRKGGVDTFHPQSSFISDRVDGSGGERNSSGFTLDPTKLNTWMITYGWLGSTPLSMYVYAGFRYGWILVHTIDFSNILDNPHLDNPSLPMHVEVIRASGTGVEAYLETGSWRAGTVAGSGAEGNTSDRRSPFFAVDRTVVSTAGTGTHLLSIRSKSTFQGKANHIQALVSEYVIASAHNKDLIVAAYPTAVLRAADPVFAAALDVAYVDINTDNSTLEQAKLPLTVDISGVSDSDIIDLALVQALRTRENLNVQGFNIYPQFEFSIVVLPPGTGTGTISLQGTLIEGF